MRSKIRKQIQQDQKATSNYLKEVRHTPPPSTLCNCRELENLHIRIYPIGKCISMTPSQFAVIVRAVNEYEDSQQTIALQSAQLREFLKENLRVRKINEALLEALVLAKATIERLKPPILYDSTQGTRDVIDKAIKQAEGKS